ncbi:MAG TPA: DNA repair protein RadC [Chitinophagaceae bacterium]|nr:DNA repair protein RadC [Chitinophagaceae bacterium]
MQEQNYSIKQWAKDDRPREKLLLKGAESLSTSELLAILIHNGTRQKSAVELAKEILRLAHNDLNELGKLSVKEMTRIKGIGEAKAITLAAAFELGRRRGSRSLQVGESIKSSQELALQLRSLLKDYRHEVMAVVFFNRSNKVISFEIISEGGITGTVVDPRIIVKRALEENAVGLVLCHNHPSGSLKPSRMDEEVTGRVQQAAAFFDICLLDHVIVSDAGYFSFADSGMM